MATRQFDKQISQADEIEKSLTAEYASERKRILQKLDLYLLPWVAVLYLMSFLDRSNIGNAKVAGMSKDLKLVGLQYNIAAAIFFIPYSLFEVPSNVILKLVPPSRWIPGIMAAWGVVITLMCLVNSFQGLVAARFFLGAAESGLFPGITYYLSMWYPRREQASRFAVFFAAATAAGAFGGILAYGIEKMDGIRGLHGWQWIFCLEGLATIVIAVFAFIFMQDFPEKATFLTESERQFVMKMRQEGQPEQSHDFNKTYIFQALKDYKTYILMANYVGLLVPIYSIALFAPSIVNELGYSAANAQLLTVPIFIVGCIFTFIAGTVSDHLNSRGPMVVGWAMVSLIGYVVLYTQSRPGVAYFGAILTTAAFVTIPPQLAWVAGNSSGDLKKSVVIAMMVGTGNLGGVCSSFIYNDPPRYLRGHGTNIGCLCMSITLCCVSMWNYNRLNKNKIRMCKEEAIDDSRAEEFKHLGDDSPLFRYVI